ncbi:hypothetical protein ABRZ10_07210 [Castellaniella ginsengisoli]|uniref:DUF551 domain-containing protein n=1 Tax=Castellaniella ginsengisoli TaxID=546114 RepID=A0AB39FBJ0_9BURK
MTINTQKLREAAANAKSLTAEDLIGFRLTATAHITGLARVIESCCDHIDAQAAEIARLREAQAWQPIETAPRDGRTLLLGRRNSLGNWRTMRGQWMSAEYIAEYWEDPDEVEPGWFETAVEAEDPPNCWLIEPTHWMPLPAAPGALSGKSHE